LIASWHDIVFLVGSCARFKFCPKESHHTTVKRIFRFLEGIVDLGLWYNKGSYFDLIAYRDDDYDGDKLERNNMSGACQFMGKL